MLVELRLVRALGNSVEVREEVRGYVLLAALRLAQVEALARDGVSGESRIFPGPRRTAYSPAPISVGQAKKASLISAFDLGRMAWMGKSKRILDCPWRDRSRLVSNAIA